MQPELLAQIPVMEDALVAAGFTVWAMVEYEADDALVAIRIVGAISVEAAKRQSSRALDVTAEEAQAAHRTELDVLAKSADHKEGLAAFAERREPKFKRE